MHFANIPKHIHNPPTSHVTSQMATQIRRAAIVCRMALPVVHIKGILCIIIGGGGACVCARASACVCVRQILGAVHQRLNRLSQRTVILVSKLHSFPSHLPSNSTVVSFTVVRPRLNNTSLIDVSCILPMPLHVTNKQNKFIQNSKVQFYVH